MMSRRLFFLVGVLFFYSSVGFSQGQIENRSKKEFYFYWGYNRSAYTTSDITMHGLNYHYKLENVVAHDRPSPFDTKVYLNPSKLSIPQFNVRLGYQVTKKWNISGGYDHMKYVVDANQMVAISGFIDSSVSAQYAGNFSGQQIAITSDFLHYEHTDGLNYISFDAEYVTTIWKSNNELFLLENRSGIGAGFLYPRTDVTIFGVKNANLYNLAGAGISLHTHMRLNIGKYFFAQFSGKSGVFYMPKIATSGTKGEYAKQNIFFGEIFGALGARFYL